MHPAVPSLRPGGIGWRAALVWQWRVARPALSSAAVGGGVRPVTTALLIGVESDYARTDLAEHGREVACQLEIDEPDVVLFTAADARAYRQVEVDGVRVDATVGVTRPTWAASEHDGWSEWRPGTINVVVQLPVALDPGAAVNAVITATEAKTQALLDAGVPGTGTASDAVLVVHRPPDAGGHTADFAGPRSPWGARLARAVHRAVAAGLGPA